MSMWQRWLERPQRIWLRRALFQVHLWTGVVAALYVVVVSVTGAALVFHWEIDVAAAAPSPAASFRPVLTYEALIAEVEKDHPGYRLSWLMLGRDRRTPVKVFLENGAGDVVRFVDPVTGGDLGAARFEPVLDWLGRLHTELLAGDAGAWVNGVGAICLAVLALTGAVVWWPGRRHWRRSTAVKWDASVKRVTWDLHSAVGFWTFAFTVIWALTGVYFIFPAPVHAVIGVFTPASGPRDAPPAPLRAPGRPLLSIDRLVAVAEAATPGAVTTWVSPPHHQDEARAVVIRHERYEPLASHSPVLYLDANNGEVQHIDVALTGNPGDTIQRWLGYLHFGNFAGPGVKILWVVVGLAPAVLGITGLFMWWNRWLGKRWRRLRSVG